MVTGNPPFYCENNKEQLLNMIKHETPFIPLDISPALQNLLEGLLTKDCEKRLGSREGAKEIKQHPWLIDFDFQRLTARELLSPFVPRLKTDTDLSHFDPEFIQSQLTPNIFNIGQNSNPSLTMRSKCYR